MCNSFQEIHVQKLNPPCIIMLLTQSDSLESQLLDDVFFIKICYIVKEISIETCI